MEVQTTDNKSKEIEYAPLGSDSKVKLSLAIARKYFAKATTSGAEATDEDVMKFIMLCKARALNPWEGDAYLQGYDSNAGPQFSLITAHQAFLKRSEINPQFDGMESGVVVINSNDEIEEYQGDLVRKGDTLIGGWAKVYRKDRKIPTYRRASLAVFDTKRSRWAKDPAGMVVKVSESDALRSSFPLSLAGLYMQDEISAIDVSEVPKETKRGVASAVALPKPRAEVIVEAPQQRTEPKPEADHSSSTNNPEPTSSQEPTPQVKLAQFLFDAGVTFDQLKAWAVRVNALKVSAELWNNCGDVADQHANNIMEKLDVSNPNALKIKKSGVAQ